MRLLRLASLAYELLSAEWLLTKLHLANGSVVIILRAIWTTTLVYAFVLATMNVIDPHRSWQFDPVQFRTQLLETGKWFAAIFAGIYTALYTRFASQWSYVAGIYNQIKAAECRKIENEQALLEWKVGFIEDAEALHVAAKPGIANVIRNWIQHAGVRDQFISDVVDGERRFKRLVERVEDACRKGG